MGRCVQPVVTKNKVWFPEYSVYDRLEILGWEFTVKMVKSKKMGLASALQGGRVIYFEMEQSGELVCLYENNEWTKKLSQENDLAAIAMSYFLTKHNRRRSKKEEKEYRIL